MKKTALVLCALSVFAMCGFGREVAAEDISKDVLAQMGLGGMQRMSDEQGMQVRGQGMASVLGIGYVAVLLSPVLNSSHGSSYNASSGPILDANAHGGITTPLTAQVQINLLGIPAISVISATSGFSFAYAR